MGGAPNISKPGLTVQSATISITTVSSSGKSTSIKTRIIIVNDRFRLIKTRLQEINRVTPNSNELLKVNRDLQAETKKFGKLIEKAKASGEIQKPDVKAAIDKGADLEIKIIELSVEQAKKDNMDPEIRAIVLRIDAELVVETNKMIEEAGIKGKGKLAELARELKNVCSKFGIGLDPELARQLGALAQLAENSSKETSPFSSQDELSFDLLQMFQNHSAKEIWELIAEWEKERDEIVERAAEKKQKEKLEEDRLKRKREDERIAQRRIKERKDEIELAAHATEYKKDLAVGYFDKIDAEVQHNLIELELRQMQSKDLNKALV